MAVIHEITEDWQREGLSPTWVKLQAAVSEFDALAADAARYRWLKDNYTELLEVRDGLDAAIDAAMKGE